MFKSVKARMIESTAAHASESITVIHETPPQGQGNLTESGQAHPSTGRACAKRTCYHGDYGVPDDVLTDEASDNSHGYEHRGTDYDIDTGSGTDTEGSKHRAMVEMSRGVGHGLDARDVVVAGEDVIDKVVEVARTSMSDDVDDPGWGPADPLPSAGGTNPGMLQGCSSYSAINAQPPEQHFNIRMISANQSISKGRGRGAAGFSGDPVVGTASDRHSSADGPTDRQDAIPDPPTDHSNFVAPSHGGAGAGALCDGTTHDDSGAQPDCEGLGLSMPRLTDYKSQPAMRTELRQQQREYKLRLEIERLRYECNHANEAARQQLVRARLDWEAEQLRAECEQM